MKSSVRFMDGLLLNAELYSDENDIIFNLTHQSRTIRNCLIAYTATGISMFKIVRKHQYRQYGVRLLVNEISSSLQTHYQYTFKGIIWGTPEITHDKDRRAFALNGTILFREDGYLYPAFEHLLKQHQVTTTDISQLISFMESFTLAAT